MQPKPRQIYIGDDAGSVEPRENIAELKNMFGNNAAQVVMLVKAFQPFLRIDRIIPKRNALRNGSQPLRLGGGPHLHRVFR